MTGGRQALDRCDLCRCGIWQRGTFQVAPQQAGVVDNCIGLDRILGKHRDSTVAGKAPVSLHVTGLPQPPITIKIKSGWDAGIGCPTKMIRKSGLLGESLKGQLIEVEIKVRENENVRCCLGDHGEDRSNLRIVALSDIAEQEPWAIPAERGSKGCDAQGFGTDWPAKASAEDQTGNMPSAAAAA